MAKKEVIGWVGATCGDEVYVDLGDDGMATIPLKDRDERWSIYCNHVRITIETLTEDEFRDWQKALARKELTKRKYGRRG